MSRNYEDFGIGEGLNNFTQSFLAARARKQEKEEGKRKNLIHLITEGMKSPEFQGDKIEALRHLGEVMGAKGKHLDQMLSTVGEMFGKGPEIPQSERLIDPGKSLEGQTRPRMVGDQPPQTYGPTHKSPFRTPGEQDTYETNRIQMEARSRAAGAAEAQEPYKVADDQRAAAKSQADIEARSRNHLAVIDYKIKNQIPAQAQAQAQKEVMGLAGAFEARGLPKDEALRQAGEEIVGRYQAKTGQVSASTEYTKAGTAVREDTPRHRRVMEDIASRQVGISQQRANTGDRAVDLRGAGGMANTERNDYQEVFKALDEIKNEPLIGELERGKGVTGKYPEANTLEGRKALSVEVAKRLGAQLRELGYNPEIGESDGWGYVKPGPVTQKGFGDVPGVRVTPPPTSTPATSPTAPGGLLQIPIRNKAGVVVQPGGKLPDGRTYVGTDPKTNKAVFK